MKYLVALFEGGEVVRLVADEDGQLITFRTKHEAEDFIDGMDEAGEWWAIVEDDV